MFKSIAEQSGRCRNFVSSAIEKEIFILYILNESVRITTKLLGIQENANLEPVMSRRN